jgi:hypothetical protein
VDDDFELELEPYELSRRFRKPDFVVLGLDLIAGVVTSVAQTLTMARDCAAMHANWHAERDIFHEEAAREIETLTGEQDG